MTEVWGMLEKSQTDAEKIEEAITAAISDHEADEEAHLGTGESLQSHKASEIIDHVIGSVVGDKMGMTQYIARTIFESLDKWTTIGNVQNDVWPGITLWSDYSPSNPAQCKSADSAIPDYIDYTKEILIQITAKIVETINKKVFFGHGFISAGDVVSGFGFKIVNSTLYGYTDASGSLETVELTGITLTNTHCYRAHWLPSESKVIFYVDGVQKGSIETESPSGTGDGDILLRIEATASGECQLNVYEVFTARDI